MSNDMWLYASIVYFHWPDALPGANAYLLFDRVITEGFYLHQIETLG